MRTATYHPGSGLWPGHGVAVGPMKGKIMYHIDPLQPRREQSTQYMGELLAGRRSAVLPRHALGRRINIYVNLSICVDLWSRLNN